MDLSDSLTSRDWWDAAWSLTRNWVFDADHICLERSPAQQAHILDFVLISRSCLTFPDIHPYDSRISVFWSLHKLDFVNTLKHRSIDEWPYCFFINIGLMINITNQGAVSHSVFPGVGGASLWFSVTQLHFLLPIWVLAFGIQGTSDRRPLSYQALQNSVFLLCFSQS